jgi:tRNA (cytidine/uridine-2'-O-)-methyltransferase
VDIVLVEPEIPQNTGNVARTCALTGTRLHLVRPLGFSLADRYLKRAGLDYWNQVEVQVWDDFTAVRQALDGQRFFLATTRTGSGYQQVAYRPDDVLVFGSESRGLAREILDLYPDNQVRIPMRDLGRSLNLSNSVAIILYEAFRQLNFPGLG